MILPFLIVYPLHGKAEDGAMPKNVELQIAAMAAADDGYAKGEAWFDEMNHPDGTEMYPGYMNIGMYVDAWMVRNLAIRIATADVVDLNSCTIFRQPDLMRVRRAWTKRQGTKPASLQQIGDELACDTLKVSTKPRQKSPT